MLGPRRLRPPALHPCPRRPPNQLNPGLRTPISSVARKATSKDLPRRQESLAAKAIATSARHPMNHEVKQAADKGHPISNPVLTNPGEVTIETSARRPIASAVMVMKSVAQGRPVASTGKISPMNEMPVPVEKCLAVHKAMVANKPVVTKSAAMVIEARARVATAMEPTAVIGDSKTWP